MYTGVQGAGEGRPGSSNRVHGARRIATVEECADVPLAVYKLAWDASKQWMQSHKRCFHKRSTVLLCLIAGVYFH